MVREAGVPRVRTRIKSNWTSSRSLPSSPRRRPGLQPQPPVIRQQQGPKTQQLRQQQQGPLAQQLQPLVPLRVSRKGNRIQGPLCVQGPPSSASKPVLVQGPLSAIRSTLPGPARLPSSLPRSQAPVSESPNPVHPQASSSHGNQGTSSYCVGPPLVPSPSTKVDALNMTDENVKNVNKLHLIGGHGDDYTATSLTTADLPNASADFYKQQSEYNKQDPVPPLGAEGRELLLPSAG